MRKTKEKTLVQCDQCRKKIEYGRDVIGVNRGVIGPRGVIPLDEESHFCSEECVSQYFDGDPRKVLDRFPARIP